MDWAAKNGNVEAVKVLLNKENDPDVREEKALKALYFAARNGYLNIFEALLGEGVNIIREKDGFTALHWASRYDCLGMVKVLLDRGTNVHAIDKDCCTALHYAAGNGHLGIVRVLLDKRANVHAKDKNSLTALDWAEKNRCSEVARVLKKAALSKVDNNNDKAPKNEVLRSIVETAIPSVTSENHGEMLSLTSENGDDSTVNQGSTTNKPLIIGSVCGVIAALAVGVGCFAAGVALPILAIAGIVVAAAVAVGLIAGGITYAVSKPNGKLEEAHIRQQEQGQALA